MFYKKRTKLVFRGLACGLTVAALVSSCSKSNDDGASSVGDSGMEKGAGTQAGNGVQSLGGGGGRSGSGAAGSAGLTITTGGNGGGNAGSGGAAAGAGSGGQTATGGAGGHTGTNSGGDGFCRMENLNRGLVAVQVSGGVYVGWRMFGYEYDPQDSSKVSYNIYRDGTKVANVADSSNYLDAKGTASSTYTLRAVVSGAEGKDSESASVWTQNYLRIPLQVPAAGTTPGSPKCKTPNEAYTYSANDASAGDLDGDGRYEIILKWDPLNAKDNSQPGCTGNVYLDAYRLDGKRLWRIDLGINIRAGAHYTQFVVYDFDGDGKAEVAVKTAPGTKDGTGEDLHLGPAASDDNAADYRSIDNAQNKDGTYQTGYILTGPEYLTVFDGQTGAERATVNFEQARGTVNAWGDNYGNRVDRFLGSAAYLDDSGLASIVMARGYYTRTTLTAWNFRNDELTQLWKFDSDKTPRDTSGKAYTGQGAHSMALADVDSDGRQEIVYGAMLVDHDGRGKCSTGLGHGDALHVGDLAPTRAGLEVFMPHESDTGPSYDVRDANTCEVIVTGPVTGKDTGRGAADDISSSNPGGEVWTNSTTSVISATTGANAGAQASSCNFLVWWDADESRELNDGTSITKYGGSPLQSCSQCTTNNGSKKTPTLTADLLGDWREEIIWRESDSSALRLYTTTAITKRRIYTLMHDPQYRMQVSSEQSAYNQPPHTSFHIGAGMADPPKPDIHVK